MTVQDVINSFREGAEEILEWEDFKIGRAHV